MTLTQLRAFLEVAATGSVRQAAERLVVSQPAVSAALASLQRELGVALVQRQGRGLVLTRAGRVYAEHARRALGLLEQARVAATGEVRPEAGTVRLAAVTTAGEHLLPVAIAGFRARYPEAEVVLEVGNRLRVWHVLDVHEVDLAIGGRPPADGRFATLATRPNTMVVVAPASGRRPRSIRSVTAADLAAQVWLLREPGSGTRSSAEELFQELGITPATLTLGSNGAILGSVQAGLGVTLLSEDAVRRELDEGRVEEWRSTGLPRRRSWHVVVRAAEQLNATAALFVRHLELEAGWELERLGADLPHTVIRQGDGHSPDHL